MRVEDYEALHDLALRLLESRTDFESGARLLPAQIPSDLPINVAIPPTTRIIGSWAHPGRAHILLETALDATTIDTFCHEELSLQGLRERNLGRPVYFPSGVGQEMGEELGLADREVAALEGTGWAQATYQIGGNGPLVVIRAQQDQQGAGSTTVEIEVGADPFEWGLDDESTDRRAETERVHRLLPVLAPPLGVQTWGGGESWGSEDAHVEASMLTDMGVQEVANHYNPQIAAVGWSEVASGVCDRVPWRQWEREEQAVGKVELVWFALHLPTTPSEYVLRLHAIRRNPLRPWNRIGSFGVRSELSTDEGAESHA